MEEETSKDEGWPESKDVNETQSMALMTFDSLFNVRKLISKGFYTTYEGLNIGSTRAGWSTSLHKKHFTRHFPVKNKWIFSILHFILIFELASMMTLIRVMVIAALGSFVPCMRA